MRIFREDFKSRVRIEISDPREPNARRSLRSFFDALNRRFDTGFDPERSISAGDEEMALPNGLLLVASWQGSPVGCGALKLHPDTRIAEVKRMWTSPDVRGLGLGRRLLRGLLRSRRLVMNRTRTLVPERPLRPDKYSEINPG